jgi:hypothetical protein
MSMPAIESAMSFPRRRESSQITCISSETSEKEPLFLLDPRFHGDDGLANVEVATNRGGSTLIGAIRKRAS